MQTKFHHIYNPYRTNAAMKQKKPFLNIHSPVLQTLVGVLAVCGIVLAVYCVGWLLGPGLCRLGVFTRSVLRMEPDSNVYDRWGHGFLSLVVICFLIGALIWLFVVFLEVYAFIKFACKHFHPLRICRELGKDLLMKFFKVSQEK